MSMTVGELVATFDLDSTGAEAGITRAEMQIAGLRRDVAGTLRNINGDVVRDSAQIGRHLGEGIRTNLDATLAQLHPEITVDANSRPADAEAHALVDRLRRLSATIDVDVPVEGVNAEIGEIRAGLQALVDSHPDITVQTRAADALVTLEATRRAVDDLNHQHAAIHVDTNAPTAVAALEAVRVAEDRVGSSSGPSQLMGMLGGLGSALGGVAGQVASWGGIFGAAASPISGLIATLVNIVPAAAIATTALLAVAQAAAVIKIGTSGIGSALKAAFAGASSAAGGTASAAQTAADGIRNARDAVNAAAVANQQAARTVETAERAVTDAQKAARQAQLDLTAARKQAARDLQDLNNSLADSQLAQRQATLDLQAAQQHLQQVRATGADANSQQMIDAQLQYDQAAQKLKEAGVTQSRLADDTAAANKAGVNGAKGVVSAQDQVIKSQRDLRLSVQALADAQAAMARTAAQGLENIAKAQEAARKANQGAAGGVNALAAALAKLAPSARAFVQEIISLKPQLEALKLDVQQRLFEGFAGSLKTTAASVLPIFRRELVNSAGALNLMGLGVLTAARGLATSGVLGSAMHSASTGLHNLAGVPGLIVTAFGQLAAAAGPQFDRLTAAVGRGAASIGRMLGDAFKSGALTDAINVAVSLIKEIGAVASNVGGVLMSVFRATSQSGGGFLGVLKTITGALDKAFASPGVQAGLQALFSTMSALGAAVGPLLVQALGVIGPVLAALGPPAKVLIAALGTGLSTIIKALGPLLIAAATAVGALTDAAAPLLPVIGQIVGDLGPSLTPIFSTLTVILRQLAPVVSQLASNLMAQLGPILKNLPVIITPLLLIFSNLATQLLPLVTSLLVQEAPALQQLGLSFGQVLVALGPVIGQLGVLLSDCLQVILPILPPIITLVAQLALIFSGQLARQITLVVVPALKLLTDILSGNFKTAGRDAKTLVNGIITVIKGLPGVALQALGAIGTALWGAGRGLIQGFIDGIVSKITNVKSTLSDLTNSLTSWKGPPSVDAKILTGNGALVMQGFMDGISTKVPALRTQLGGITAGLPGMTGRLGVAPGSMNRAAPAGGGSTAPIHVTVMVGGRAVGEALIDPLRKSVNDRGGDVQVVLGTGRGSR